MEGALTAGGPKGLPPSHQTAPAGYGSIARGEREEMEDTVQRLPLAPAFPWPPPPLALLASPATSAPEGAPSRGLVIAGKLRQLFLCHGSSVAVLLHCLLGIRLFYDKSRFLLAFFKCI